MTNIINKSFFLFFFLFIGGYVFSQTAEQREKIKSQTNTEQLEALKKRHAKTQLSTEELKAKAKRKNIPYRKEVDGKVYELQGFDPKDHPIYYITNNKIDNKSSDETQKSCAHTCCQSEE